MSQMDDPNREAVGVEPIWTGAGDPPDPPPEGGATSRRRKAKDADGDTDGGEQEQS
jgi:hypothetical protein